MEERRFNSDEPSFGNESRQSEIIRNVIEQTGCDVEISQAKDHSLTIMVTGKPICVLGARKAILSKLQTQVSEGTGEGGGRKKGGRGKEGVLVGEGRMEGEWEGGGGKDGGRWKGE